jgi:acyl carrier protein
VLDRTQPSVTGRIAALLQPMLAKRGIARAVELEDNLTEVGLSSLDMVNLMLAVEAEFDVKIPDADMTPANFRSIGRIETLIRALRDVG